MEDDHGVVVRAARRARRRSVDARAAAGRLGSEFFLAWHEAMLGYFARGRGDHAAARAAFARAAERSRLAGDPSTGGFVECWWAALDAETGDMPRARERLTQLLETASRTGSDLALPESLYAMARLLLACGAWAESIALVELHVAPLREMGIPTWASQLLLILAAAHRQGGNLPAATDALEQAWALIDGFGNATFESLVHFERALLAHAGNDHARTVAELHRALALQHTHGLRRTPCGRWRPLPARWPTRRATRNACGSCRPPPRSGATWSWCATRARPRHTMRCA